MASNVALVTGGNKGIGLAIVKALSSHPEIQVLLTARNAERGKEALAELKANNVSFLQLDIDDEKSIAEAAKTVKDKYAGLDILINNAAIAFKGDAFDENVARTTAHTNLFGTLHTLNYFYPLMKQNGRVVNVSSQAGSMTLSKLSDELANQYLDENITIEKIVALQNKFIKDVAENQWEQRGWPKSAYGVSKLGVTMATRAFARDHPGKGIIFSSVCPGYVKTDMSSHKGHRTPEEGAEGIVHLAFLPDGSPNGKFWFDKQVIPWSAGGFRRGNSPRK